ncbi:MAG: reverse transcriptase family protein [Rhodospirillales bacterium]
MVPADILARRIAALLAAGHWDRPGIVGALDRYLGAALRPDRRSNGDLPAALADDILAAQETPYPPSPAQLAAIIRASARFEPILAAVRRHGGDIGTPLLPPRFEPVGPLAHLPVPPLATAADVAAWLGLPLAQLDWLADARRGHVRAATRALQHYDYRWLPKAAGPPRLVEAPKPRLKAVQRRILADILDRLPPHDAAYGFVRGRSARMAAALHAGERLVVAADLADFFPSVPASRVHAVFRSLGYPAPVARLLSGLCATATPLAVLDGPAPGPPIGWQSRQRLRTPHLAQGAPTSPALANLCAYRLDCRLAGLAAAAGARYTRYADDLTFSGDDGFARRHRSLLAAVARIAADEGFALNPRKTRAMGRGRRQRVTGLVVNRHVNVARDDYDRLKAILTNCVRHGAAAQDRAGHRDFRAHLDGRVSWVEGVNPRRGLKLRRLLESIVWSSAQT